jgi:Mg-chelatase subunit ChlD
MAAIWIILLDVSGSMGEGFSKKSKSTDPMAEIGRWKTKLDAAKELLVRQVHATRGQDIAVIPFSTHARCAFKGTLAAFRNWEQKLEQIQPEEETNLAEALTLVEQDRDFERYSAIAVLVLSDGLSNIGNPREAAESLIDKYSHGRIDTILIDETSEGRKVAEQISINGWVRPAESLIQLEKAVVSGRAASLRQGLSSLAYQRFDMENALADATSSAPPALLIMSSPADFELTPESLTTKLAPALSGFEGIERVSCDIYETPYLGRISSISQTSPVSISVSGWEKILDLFKLIFSWGREHAHNMNRLEEEKLKAEIEKIHSESAQGYAKAMQMSAEADRIDFENRLRREESERQKLERRKIELEIEQDKICLAENLFEKLLGNKEIHQSMRQAYVQRISASLDLVIGSKLEFQVERVPTKENKWNAND